MAKRDEALSFEFLQDASAFASRFVLAQVLGPPRSKSGVRPARPRLPPAPRLVKPLKSEGP